MGFQKLITLYAMELMRHLGSKRITGTRKLLHAIMIIKEFAIQLTMTTRLITWLTVLLLTILIMYKLQ